MPRRSYPHLHNRDWLYRQYVEEQRSLPEMADIVGCSTTAVFAALQRNGIPVRDRAEAGGLQVQYPQLRDRDWLWQHYVVEDLPASTIAELVGCSVALVQYVITNTLRGQEHTRRGHTAPQALLEDVAWLRERYVQNGLSPRKMAALAGLSFGEVQAALVRHGFMPPTFRKEGTIMATTTMTTAQNDDTLLRQLVAATLNEHVQHGREFTAFDITVALRRAHPRMPLPQERVGGLVHIGMETLMHQGVYKRELRNSEDGQAWLYMPGHQWTGQAAAPSVSAML